MLSILLSVRLQSYFCTSLFMNAWIPWSLTDCLPEFCLDIFLDVFIDVSLDVFDLVKPKSKKSSEIPKFKKSRHS